MAADEPRAESVICPRFRNSPPISTHPLLSSLMPQPDNAMRKEPLTGFLTGFLMRF